MLGYCDFAKAYCCHVLDDGNCVYDSIYKCDNLSVIEALEMRKEETMFDSFISHKYVENEPPKPNHDLVEVTRCKDCKLDGTEECGMRHGLMGHKDDDYCSYGERKNAEE